MKNFLGGIDNYGLGYNEAIDDTIDIVRELDEPEKPVVSQFVADWYEDNKDEFEDNVYNLCVLFYTTDNKPSRELNRWFDCPISKPIETLVKMKLYGYKVEKEKLYRMRHKLTGEYLSQNYAKTGYYHSLDHFHILKLSKKDWEYLTVWGGFHL